MKMNRIFSATATLSGLALLPAFAWAQQQTETFRHGYGGHMAGWGGGSHGMIFGPIFMIVALVVVVVLVVLLVRWLGGSWSVAQPSHPAQSGRTPLDILKERYARGEIDKDEFEERRSVLGD
ncbi:MAG: SHOCT domain-containing protein [Rhodospirillaceae bacterium]|nr:SHOCT domain-containing protein [Rhodospirillaceae bacterium]